MMVHIMALAALFLAPEAQKTCPGELFNSASWPQTQGGSSASGSCESGYSGLPQRACFTNGTWATLVTDNCERNSCPASTSQNSIFPLAYSGQTIFGTCQEGYAGRPSRTCGQDGTWGVVMDPCLPKINCLKEDYFARASWPEVAYGEYAKGTCEPGFVGTPLRQCEAGGIWSTLVFNHCQRIACQAITENHMYFPPSASKVNAMGTCLDGYYGNPAPRRLCNPDGSWSDVVGSCVAPTDTPTNPKPTTPTSTPTPSSAGSSSCSAETFNSADWAQTLAGQYATGTCVAGYSPSMDGLPQRFCKADGTWSTLVINNCERNFCVNDVAGNAEWNATFESETTPGTCLDGYTGRPFRTCQADGTWGAVQDPCKPFPPCPSEITDHANWPKTASGLTAQGTCLAGYQGTPSRQCVNGAWEQITDGCQRITCPQITEGNAVFASTPSGTITQGECASPFLGNPSPSRECQLDGTWGAITSGGCELPPNCQADCDFANARFESTAPGQTAVGTCHYGYRGSPVRQCRADGTWESSVKFPCVLVA